MSDIHDKETRSYNMSRIRGKDTKPELLVRRFLFSKGFRYKLHDKKLPGKPDIVFPKLKSVIFVHGLHQNQESHIKQHGFMKEPEHNIEMHFINMDSLHQKEEPLN